MAELLDLSGSESNNGWLSRIVKLQVSVAVLTVVVSAVVGLLMIPLVKQKAELQQQVDGLRGQEEQLRFELKKTQDQLERSRNALTLPAKDVQLLVSRGVVFRNAKSESWQAIAEQALAAAEELKNYKSLPADTTRRRHVTIRYYVRESDQGGVIDAMTRLHKDYGFTVVANTGKKEPNTSTNAVWLNRDDLQENDLKLVAYYLMMYGFQVKYIGPPSSLADEVKRKVREAVVVVAEPKADGNRALTVEDVRKLSSASMKAGTSNLN